MSVVAATSKFRRDMAVGQRRFSAYPSYQPSGVAWLPNIPGGWSIKRLRYALTLPTKSEIRGLPPGTVVSFVPMEAVGEYGGLSLEQTKVIEDVLNGYTYFRDGDVVVAKITPCFENGKGALAEGLEGGIGFGTTELHVLRARPELDRRYLFYLTLSEDFRRLGTVEMYGAGGQKRVPESFIRELRHPIPPLDEQRAIAAFLDRETVRIDALIAKKQRLIELLQEKREAVVSFATTQGMCPAIATRDSRIPWLGQIAAHWRVERLKFRYRRIEQGWSPQCENRAAEPGEWGILKVGCMNTGVYDETENKALPADLVPIPHYEVRVGDFLMSRSNTSELVGSVGRVHATQGRIMLCDKLYRIEIDESKLNPAYAVCLLRSRAARLQLARDATGASASMKNISNDRVGNLVFAFPDLDEQRHVVAELTTRLRQLDNVEATIRSGVDRLREYRSALISAAVTGKIDVRGQCEAATEDTRK